MRDPVVPPPTKSTSETGDQVLAMVRIHQRLAYAKTADSALVDELANYYVSSGRIASLWREIFSVRNSFVNCYIFIRPLITVQY
jgi:hypothetical protein